MFIFLLADHETTAHTIAYVLALLALYHNEQEKLFQHIKSILPDGPIPMKHAHALWKNWKSSTQVKGPIYILASKFQLTKSGHELECQNPLPNWCDADLYSVVELGKSTGLPIEFSDLEQSFLGWTMEHVVRLDYDLIEEGIDKCRNYFETNGVSEAEQSPIIAVLNFSRPDFPEILVLPMDRFEEKTKHWRAERARRICPSEIKKLDVEEIKEKVDEFEVGFFRLA
ncbi:hypothetical protein D9758_012427 [Tetrapyrgos nigripes]|uniref:Cytochrome P450 n=1 Tax=Tetrapyrgos nigripes TaxID=182062 RepID=A0A8H5FZ18_9AGAR|nr:hypothetical protein D9758_012427 [Tetrapyrgos nigripes]